MFMRDSTRRRGVRFWNQSDIEFEFESFWQDELKDLYEDKEIQNNSKKMEWLLANV